MVTLFGIRICELHSNPISEKRRPGRVPGNCQKFRAPVFVRLDVFWLCIIVVCFYSWYFSSAALSGSHRYTHI